MVKAGLAHRHHLAKDRRAVAFLRDPFDLQIAVWISGAS